MTATIEDLGPVTLAARSFDDLLDEAVVFHGHLCPGQVLGVRIVLAGCRALGLAELRQPDKRLVVFVEIDRCATDAIQALTGVSLGKGTLRHLDYGKMAATFVDVPRGAAVRVAARDDARALARRLAPGEPDSRRAQIRAYRVMPEADLLRVEPVVVDPARLERWRERVPCAACGEEITYRRWVTGPAGTLCRPCAGDGYYTPAPPAV